MNINQQHGFHFSLLPFHIVRGLMILLCFVTCLWAADLKILHMDGVFDLDNDDLVEFLTIEDGQGTGGVVTRIGYYEIDELGYPQLLWNLDAPRHVNGSIINTLMADIDGSGIPEIVVAANVRAGNGDDFELAMLYIFDWVQGEFSSTPSLTLALADTLNPQSVNNLDLLDLQGDGRDEIVVSLHGPEPVISVITLSEIEDVLLLEEFWSYPLEEFSSSAGQLFVSSVDYNRDGKSELYAFSPERNILRIQSFLNTDGQLNPGPSLLQRVPGMSELLFRSLLKLDWNNDNLDDLVIPFRSGHVVSLSIVERKIEATELGIDAGPLSDLNTADFNQDGISDLLLVSGQQGVVTLAYGATVGGTPLQEFFSISAGEDEDGTQIFSAVPEIVDDIYLGTVIAGGWTGLESEIFYFELGSVPEYPEEILIDTYIPQARLEEPIEEPPLARPMEGRPLPPGILPTYILPVNQTFAYTVPEEEEREFFSFRWLEPPPRGMYFHYETRSVEWVPDEQQLGAYELTFNLKMKVGENIDIITEGDTVVTYQVIPELVTVQSRFWIYVNDPPQISSFPEGTEFVAGSRFTYQVVASDKNEDAHLRYTLEKSPEGMNVDENGFISWQTDDSHINIYEVRLIVSDGFDRAAQIFKLYSRGQVVITSYPELEATAGKLYEYQVQVRIPEDKRQELLFTLLKAPYGMLVDNTGHITWEPQSAQVDTQTFVVSANHGIASDSQRVSIFVNHPPILVSVPDQMNKVSIQDTLDFQLEVDDPNEFDVIRYDPVSLPPGMRVDPSTGRILWVPSEENLDFSTAVLEITDGKEVIELSFDLFVNAPIHITSEPVTLGAVGKLYNYPVATSDLNGGSLMTFSHVTPVYSLENTRVYSVQIEDDVFRENIDRHIGEFKNKKSILIETSEEPPGEGVEAGDEQTVSRINLRKYVQDVFWENDLLYVVIRKIGGRQVKIKDVLWEFFEGNKGKPPKVLVERVTFTHYTLLDFPDGMFIDELTGIISWTPALNQYDNHVVTYMVSDGYTRDEQSFDLYVNHPPTIISTPPKIAQVNRLYKYKAVVEDKNSDKELTYKLMKAPKGMQISRDGRITWMPRPSQINSRLFTVQVSDGYAEDIQDTKLFVNISPNVISNPKPVALTNFEYRYRMVTEDLNGDDVKLRAIKIPKYARFDKETGMFRWKPRMNQRGVNDIVISAIDDRGLATSHEFQIHVFEDPSSQQFVSTSWPLLLAFVGAMFTVGVTALR